MRKIQCVDAMHLLLLISEARRVCEHDWPDEEDDARRSLCPKTVEYPSRLRQRHAWWCADKVGGCQSCSFV